MICSNCSKENPAGSRFCQFCGAGLSVEAARADLVPDQENAPAAVAPRPQKPAAPSQGARLPVSPAAQIGQLGDGGTAAGSIWGPFAGYGTRGRHVSWLLDDLGHRSQELHQAITERFQLREVPGSQEGWRTLIAKGLLVQRRPFYLIQRGITTVALHISQFGQDLYISQVTYVKGPISNLRVAIVGLMLLFYLYYVTLYRAALLDSLMEFNPLSFSGGGAFPFLLACVIGPLGLLVSLLLFLLVIFSTYKFITEKDFLAPLRARPNEFEEDDTVALEKSVEETVRQALDTIGIDRNLMPPSEDYGLRARVI